MGKHFLFESKKDLFYFLKNTLLIIAGTFVMTFGVSLFIIPFNLITGGIPGISIVLKELLSAVPFLNTLTTEVYASVINWIFFILGLIFLGKRFAMKTLISAIVYPVALNLFSLLKQIDFFNLNSALYDDYKSIAIVLAAVFGGAAIGAGVSMTFFGGGSTGGVDIIALSICKHFKKAKSSVILFCIDTTIIISGMFLIHNFVISLLGIVSAFICAIAIDRMFIGSSRAFTAQIVTDKYEQINDAVIHRMHRTTTISDAVGGYSGLDKKVISVTFSMSQYAEFTAIISTVDKNAFVTVHRAHEINGEGWTWGLHDEDAKKQF